MSILKNILKKTVDEITPSWLISGVKRLVHEDFMQAFTASCALIACADGKIDEDEKNQVRGYIRNMDELKSFNSEKVMSLFSEYVDALNCDFDLGQKKVYKALDEIKENYESSFILVRACCAIGKADGNFDPDEKKRVKEICNYLNVDSGEFDL